MNYCVYGASSDAIDPAYLAGGEELGRCLAERGHGIVFGGGRRGMMGATARGVLAVRRESGLEDMELPEEYRGGTVPEGPRPGAETGPQILGVSPTFFNEPGILDPWSTRMIYTENMRLRKERMEQEADGFIITPGGLGTWDEFFEIATLRQLGQHGKPIAILNLCGYYDPVQMMLQRAVEGRFMAAETAELYRFFKEPEELVAWIEKQEEYLVDWRENRYKK